MKQLRRLEVTAPQDSYRKLQRGLLRNFQLDEPEFRVLEGKRPELIAVDGDAVLVAQPRDGLIAQVHYAYPGRDAFVRQFPPMFERVISAVRQEEAPLGVRLTLVDRPSRPYVEPVLFAHAFEVQREWMEMTLHELPAPSAGSGQALGATGGEIAPGFLLRPAAREDAPTIIELEDAAFPYVALTPQAVAGMLDGGQELWLLEDSATARVAGYLRLRRQPPATGYVAILAVHPHYQRRGLGEAMLRWALAWFRGQGLRRASLTVSTDNAPAIALYRKLGFAPGEMGFDYRRPIDEEEVRQVLERRRGAHIRVRRRY